MIDPTNVTNFNRTEIELQEYFLFCVCVAGKTAFVQAKKLEQFLEPARLKFMMPFEYIDSLVAKGMLETMINQSKLGQYNRLTEIFKRCTSLDLQNVTIEQLERMPGIGPKTSRFFMMHTRPNQRYAVLDTHILSWLSERYPNATIPRSTPQSAGRYRTIENIFLKECDNMNLSPEILDLQIWTERARKTAA